MVQLTSIGGAAPFGTASVGGGTRQVGGVGTGLAPPPGESPTLTQEQIKQMGDRSFNEVNPGYNLNIGMAEKVGRSLASVGITLADDLWAAPINPIGWVSDVNNKGDVWSLASSAFGPENARFYDQNKGGIDAASGVVGIVGSLVLGDKLVTKGLSTAMAGSTAIAGSRAYQFAKGWEAESQLAVLAAQKAAVTSRESFSMLGSAAGREFLAAKVATNVGVAARQEALIYATMWENDTVNMEGVADDAFWIGIGLGIGGVGAVIQSRSILRKAMNSDDVKTALGAMTPMAGTADLMTRDAMSLNDLAKIRPEGRVTLESVDFTVHATAARAGSDIDKPGRVLGAENAMRAIAEKEAEASATRILNRGITGAEVEKVLPAGSPEIRNLVHNVAKADIGVLHGADEVGILRAGDNVESVVLARETKLEANRAQAAIMVKTKQARKGRELAAETARKQKQSPFVLVNGTWLAPSSPTAKAATSFNQQVAKARVMFDNVATEASVNLPNGKSITIDGSLTIRTSSSQGAGRLTRKMNYAAMQPVDRLYAQEAMNKMVKELAKPGQKAKFKVSARNQGDWLALDLADEVLTRGGKVEFDPKSLIKDHEGLKRESIRAKAKAVLAETGSGPIDAEMRLKYNLPEPTAMERLEDPDGLVIRRWLEVAATPTGTTRDLSNALNKGREVAGLDLRPLDGLEPSRLNGNMIGWNRDENGNFLKPMLGYFNPPSQMTLLSKMGHEEAFMAKVAEKAAILTNRVNNSFVSSLSRNLIASPAFNLARKTAGLHANQMSHLGSTISRAVSEFLPRSFLARDSKEILAARKLHEDAVRGADMVFAAELKDGGLEKFLGRIDTPASAAIAAQLDAFHSLRPGWRIESTVEVEPGWFGFVIDNSEINQKMYGGPVPKGTLMPNKRLNKPILMQAEALAMQKEYNRLTTLVQNGDNTLRKANGRRDIANLAYYVKSQDTKGKFVGFVFDQDDRLVLGNVIVAKNADEYKRLEGRAIGENGKAGDLPTGYTIRTREQLEATQSIWDKEAIGWIDSGHSAATNGIGSQSGALSGIYTRQGAFKESLLAVKEDLRRQASETVESLMEEPLKLVRTRNAVEKSVNPNAGRTIYDEYEMALTGKSAGYRESGILAPASVKIEQGIDRILSASAISMPAFHIMDIARRFGVSPTEISQSRSYRQMVDVMGDKSPYKDVTEFLAAQNVRMPPTVANVARKLNSLATTMILRWDPLAAHASMNMIGLIPTLLAGTRAGAAPNALSMAVKGRNVGFVDSLSVIRGGMKDMLSKKGTADFDWMVRHGDANQSAFEYRQVLNSVENHTGFNKMVDRIDEVLSYASDGSENLSRQMSHFVGLRLADYQGIKGMSARHNFARDFANSSIADYNPSNRPELYNTALGSVVGLFQSYVTSQYTKMFRWIEDGQWAAFGTQAAAQAALFGIPSTYGVGHLFDLADSGNATGEPSLMDAAYHRFGPVIGGALMNGGIAELAQVSLWTRGDINLRVPVLGGQLPPGIDVLKRFGTAFTGVVQESLNQGPVDALPAMIEIVQREMPNRVLKGIMAITMLDGKETDRYGQVMTETRDWLDAGWRIAGLRSRRAQQELQVFYQNKSDLDRDAARMDTVRQRLRTDVRKAASDNQLINPDDYFESYVAAGGTPRRYRSWLKQIMNDATTTRAAQQLKKSIEAPRNNLALWRYGAYGAWGIDDGTTPTP